MATPFSLRSSERERALSPRGALWELDEALHDDSYRSDLCGMCRDGCRDFTRISRHDLVRMVWERIESGRLVVVPIAGDRGGGDVSSSLRADGVAKRAAAIRRPPVPEPEPPPRPLARPAPKSREIVCEMVDLSVTCEHKGRQAHSGKILEVVPTKTHGSDTIKVHYKVKNGHADDPRLTLDGDPLSEASFGATGPVTSKLWIPSFAPKVYEVTAETCSGTARTVEVHAYPGNKISLELAPQKQFHALKEIGDHLKEVLHVVTDKLEIKVLEGSLSVEAAWKEHTDERAFYAYNFQGAMDLIAAEFTQTIGPSKISNLASKIPGAGKYLEKVIDWLVKAGIVIQVAGKIGISAGLERKSPDQKKFVDGRGAGVEGSLQISVGVVAAAWNDKVISVKLAAQAGVTGKGELTLAEEGLGIEVGATFDGLKGIGMVQFLWGWVQAKHGVTFIEQRQFFGPREIHLWPRSADNHPGASKVAEVHG